MVRPQDYSVALLVLVGGLAAKPKTRLGGLRSCWGVEWSWRRSLNKCWGMDGGWRWWANQRCVYAGHPRTSHGHPDNHGWMWWENPFTSINMFDCRIYIPWTFHELSNFGERREWLSLAFGNSMSMENGLFTNEFSYWTCWFSIAKYNFQKDPESRYTLNLWFDYRRLFWWLKPIYMMFKSFFKSTDKIIVSCSCWLYACFQRVYIYIHTYSNFFSVQYVR